MCSVSHIIPPSGQDGLSPRCVVLSCRPWTKKKIIRITLFACCWAAPPPLQTLQLRRLDDDDEFNRGGKGSSVVRLCTWRSSRQKRYACSTMPCQCTYRPTWMHPRPRTHAGCAPFGGGRLAGPDRRRTMQASQSRRTTTAARITSNPTFQPSTRPLPARQAGRRAANHPGWPPGVHAAQDDEPDQPGQTINFFAARAPSAAGGGIMSVGGGGAPWADLPADGSLR